MKSSFAIFFIVLLIAGCATDTVVENVRIDSNVLLTLKEEISNDGRKFVLEAETDSNYNCSNYSIAYQYQKNGNVIDVNFTHIIEPSTCATGIGPAKAKVNLGSLLPGNYTIQFLVNESVMQAPLIISNEEFKILDSSRAWIELVNPVLNRIPENGIWGHVGFSSDSFVVKQVEPFFDSLKILGAQEYDFVPGEYTYFEVDSSGAIHTYEEPGTENVRSFAYIFNDDIQKLRDLIKWYGKNSPLSIALFTTKGDAFYTWQLGAEP